MAQSLSDFFSKELKEKLVDIPISLKGIVLIEIPEFLSAKGDKFAILVSQSNCKGFIALVSINTNKPFSGNYYTLKKKEYPFLKYDSHVGCDFISDRPTDEITKFLINNPERIKGELPIFSMFRYYKS
ncbi:hypothetical protein [Mucilaginibacter psychrotolerans]|uniref:Uncharacterized protein n=1 Tax=Mucilaginibacter psychrotolerans TaxID=1524096 RepID=A0A4Y8SDD0_9SPHI|nr:hypothetical protein [Mucilaginibacter psychrotolerans]TFF37093.1 hypothetical protein E2R66_13505 [Mucilaginibacter psychrotolerans]